MRNKLNKDELIFVIVSFVLSIWVLCTHALKLADETSPFITLAEVKHIPSLILAGIWLISAVVCLVKKEREVPRHFVLDAIIVNIAILAEIFLESELFAGIGLIISVGVILRFLFMNSRRINGM